MQNLASFESHGSPALMLWRTVQPRKVHNQPTGEHLCHLLCSWGGMDVGAPARCSVAGNLKTGSREAGCYKVKTERQGQEREVLGPT